MNSLLVHATISLVKVKTIVSCQECQGPAEPWVLNMSIGTVVPRFCVLQVLRSCGRS